MLRGISIAILAVLPLRAAIFPERLGEYLRSEPKPLAAPDQQLFAEYGFEEGEQADFVAGDQRFSATAWRLHDSTAALGVLQLRRAPQTTKGLPVEIIQHANYVLELQGTKLDDVTRNQLYTALPKVYDAPLPALTGFLPVENRIVNSERYVLGPVSLERFEPKIPPSLAAFHLGAEGQLAKYKTPKGELTLALLSYPTPNMARERFDEFQKLPGAVARRAGPLLAVIMQPVDPDEAERTLARVHYEAKLTVNENAPQNFNKGLSNMILSIMALAGIISVIGVIVGVGFGGFRVLKHKLGFKEDPPPITVLRLRD
jgi:hypothetical protein